jgi:hypothetical protein
MRRDFQLAEEDEAGLLARGRTWEAILENRAMWVILPDYPIPPGFNVAQATAALRIPPSYPDDQIDMVYFHPSLALANGKGIAQLSALMLDGKTYQQWSRHRTGANPWRPGLDNVSTHLLLVDSWLSKEAGK